MDAIFYILGSVFDDLSGSSSVSRAVTESINEKFDNQLINGVRVNGSVTGSMTESNNNYGISININNLAVNYNGVTSNSATLSGVSRLNGNASGSVTIDEAAETVTPSIRGFISFNTAVAISYGGKGAKVLMDLTVNLSAINSVISENIIEDETLIKNLLNSLISSFDFRVYGGGSEPLYTMNKTDFINEIIESF